MEEQLAGLLKTLEEGEGRKEPEFQYLCGKIRGIREAIGLLNQVRHDYRLDDDIDLAS